MLIKFLFTAKGALAQHSNWRTEIGNCLCMADVFPKIFRLAAFFFYDVGLEPLTAFALAIPTYPPYLTYISFPIIFLSLFYITPGTTAVCYHNSDDSISQLSTRSPNTLHSTLTDIYNHELYPRYWGTSP